MTALPILQRIREQLVEEERLHRELIGRQTGRSADLNRGAAEAFETALAIVEHEIGILQS